MRTFLHDEESERPCTVPTRNRHLHPRSQFSHNPLPWDFYLNKAMVAGRTPNFKFQKVNSVILGDPFKFLSTG